MGKASSSKKVAAAARAGTAVKGRERRELGFPMAVLLVIVLGTGLVLYARSSVADALAPKVNVGQANDDHWHAPIGIYNCDKWEPNIADSGVDPNGIHTHGDGVIHIHPSNSSAAGNKARMKVFFDAVGLTVTDTSMTFADGNKIEAGADCNGAKTVLRVARFNADKADKPTEIITSNFGNIRFNKDREAYTFAFMPADKDIPAPPSIAELGRLTDVGPGASTTTVPGAVSGATTTTEPGATTVAPSPSAGTPATTVAPATTN
jgi:hypothetical protein